MDRVVACSEPIHLDAPAKFLGPQAPMDEPLLIPNVLQRPRRRFACQRQDRRSAEGSEADLRQRSVRIEPHIARAASPAVVNAPVWIPGVGEITVVEQIDTGDEVRLEKRVDIYVMRQITAIPAKCQACSWNCRGIYPILHGEPALEVRHIIDVRRDRYHLGVDSHRAKIAWLQEELRYIRTNRAARISVSEQSFCRDHTAVFRPMEVRQFRQIRSRLLCQ